MKATFLCAALLALAICPHVFAGVPPDSSKTEDLDRLVNEAIDNNQEILAAQKEMRVMDERAVQAGSLDDPELVTVAVTVAPVPSGITARLLADNVSPRVGGGGDEDPPPPQESAPRLAATTAARVI